MKIIPVTCAIIFFEGKVLATQRSEKMDLPGKWEFPGGKMEPHESPEECLKREIKEELSLEIEIVESLRPVLHHYSDKSIRLIPFAARWKAGQIHLAEHSQLDWIEKKDLFFLDWAPADLPIVHELQEKWVKLVSPNPS